MKNLSNQSALNYSIGVDRLGNLELVDSHNLKLHNIVAQSVSDPDVLGQMVSIWNNFVTSGQIWALSIGFILGYLLRGITA